MFFYLVFILLLLLSFNKVWHTGLEETHPGEYVPFQKKQDVPPFLDPEMQVVTKPKTKHTRL